MISSNYDDLSVHKVEQLYSVGSGKKDTTFSNKKKDEDGNKQSFSEILDVEMKRLDDNEK